MISSEAKSFKAKSLGVEVGMEQNCNMAVQAGESSVGHSRLSARP